MKTHINLILFCIIYGKTSDFGLLFAFISVENLQISDPGINRFPIKTKDIWPESYTCKVKFWSGSFEYMEVILSPTKFYYHGTKKIKKS